jgi:hypothetical protein
MEQVPAGVKRTESRSAATGGAVVQQRRRKKAQKSGCDQETARKFVYDWYGPFPHIPDAPFLEWPKLLFWEIVANWKAGITVALVSVPLSISLALAAQASPGTLSQVCCAPTLSTSSF